VGARLLPLSLLAGVAAGVATAAVYQRGWSLALATATVVVVLVVTPPGWGTRLPYAVGYAALVGYLSVPRGEGDYAISSSGPGYAVLGLAVLVVAFAVGTLPRPGRRAVERTDTGGSGGSAGLE
jgi:hypothetical protein